MLLKLKELKPNPFRNFRIDPIDEARVDQLVVSIKQDDFWSGPVVRQNRDGDYEILAGQHRVLAAIKSGIEEADLFVGQFDDAAAIRVYAVENATQRGPESTAQAGTVSSAITFLARAILTDTRDVVQPILERIAKSGKSDDELASEEFLLNLRETTNQSWAILRGRILTSGIGQNLICAFFEGVAGINPSSVDEQLKNLKTSGEYAMLIREVSDQIEAENAAELERIAAEERRLAREAVEQERLAEERRIALEKANADAAKAKEERIKREAELEAKRLEAEANMAAKRKVELEQEAKQFEAKRTQTKASTATAHKAAEKAAERDVTFDFEGVAQSLKNADHLRTFRNLVTGDGMRPYLPVNQQASLAAELVAECQKTKRELSSAFIRKHINALLLNAKGIERKLSKEEQAEILRNDRRMKAASLQSDFSRSCRSMVAAGLDLQELAREFEKSGEPMPLTAEFRNNLETTLNALTKLKEVI